MSRKEVLKQMLIGFLVTIACNLVGMYFYVSTVKMFSDLGFIEAIKASLKMNVFSNIVALGAILDFLAFFIFLKKGKFNHVKGVLFGVITAAIVVLIFKLKSW